MALPICRGRCCPRAQSFCVATLPCCPGHRQGIPNTGLERRFPESPEPTMSEGQGSSLAAASLRKPALQELTGLNSPDFSPYLFSRQELTLAIPLSATTITIPAESITGSSPPSFPSLFRASLRQWMRRRCLQPGVQSRQISATEQCMWRG